MRTALKSCAVFLCSAVLMAQAAPAGSAKKKSSGAVTAQDVRELRQALAAQAHVVHVLSGPRTITAALAATPDGRGSGRVLVDATSGEAAIVVAGLGPAPTGKVYELWAIRGAHPPEPAGVFPGSPEASVAARTETVAHPDEVTQFAVSIEPAGGSRTPTGPIVLAGAVAR